MAGSELGGGYKSQESNLPTIVRHDFLFVAVDSGHHTTLGSNGWRLLHRYFNNYENRKRRLETIGPNSVFLRSLYEQLVAVDEPLLEGMFMDARNINPESFKRFVEADVRPGDFPGIGPYTLGLYTEIAIEKQLIDPKA